MSPVTSSPATTTAAATTAAEFPWRTAQCSAAHEQGDAATEQHVQPVHGDAAEHQRSEWHGDAWQWHGDAWQWLGDAKEPSGDAAAVHRASSRRKRPASYDEQGNIKKYSWWQSSSKGSRTRRFLARKGKQGAYLDKKDAELDVMRKELEAMMQAGPSSSSAEPPSQ